MKIKHFKTLILKVAELETAKIRIKELEAILQEIIDTACVGKGKEVTVRSTRFNAPASILFRAYAAMKGTEDGV